MFTNKPPKDIAASHKEPLKPVVINVGLFQSIAFTILILSVCALVLAFAFWINRQ